jgi:type VI secretion system Hcp family effector
MAATIYVNMGDDAKGECLEKDHTDWIEAISCNHIITQPKSTTRHVAGGTQSEAQHGDFGYKKHIDKASANLYKLVCDGTHLAKVTVELVKPIASKQAKYMVYEFKNVVITGVQLDADTAGEDNPTETISFSYDTAAWTYTQVGPDGKSKGNVASNWSRATAATA